MKISVAMAYYNGGTYIEEQMDSILSQLGEKDEVIVSVDGASDGSKPLLLKMAEVDSRIHIVKGPGKGVVRNFENAIRHCNGDIIYLSDQDDIWKPDKVEKVNYAFSNPEVKAVLHDAEIVDENGVATGAASLFSYYFFNAIGCRPKIFVKTIGTGIHLIMLMAVCVHTNRISFFL